MPGKLVRVHILNHACATIKTDSFKMVIDPWLMGTCFDGGWGLRFDNPNAFEHVRDCSHLWISHFHGDHYHIPTLKKILEINPNIICIGNASANFQMDSALRRLGFTNVIPFKERKTFELTEGVTIERIPATGIDNMLLLRIGDFTLLNYNDCVLPPFTKRTLAKKIGSIDVFMSNFNHAGKLLKNPLPSDEKIRDLLEANFKNTFIPFNPRWVVPFASHHYYRAKESLQQNKSLLSVQDLETFDSRVIPVRVGDACDFDLETKSFTTTKVDPVLVNPRETADRLRIVTKLELIEAAKGYCAGVRKAYGLVRKWADPLLVFVKDLNVAMVLDYSHGASFNSALKCDDCDIATTSEALLHWLSKIYGTDSFVVGAHFDLVTNDIGKIKKHIIFGMTIDNKIDLRSIVKMACTPKGAKFLYNRREEALGILVNRQIGSDYQN